MKAVRSSLAANASSLVCLGGAFRRTMTGYAIRYGIYSPLVKTSG